MFYDYAIIIALQEERDYFFEALSQPVQVVHEDDLLINPLYLSLKNKDRVTGAVCCVGEMGLAPATNLTQRVLHVLHPRLIISLGLSGIINPDLHLGDTVIGLSSHHYLHEAAAVGNPQASSETPFGGAIALQGDTLKPSKDLIDLLTDFRSSFVDAYRKWQDIAAEELSRLIDVNTISKLQGASLISDFVRLKVGHLACGELVIANTKAKDWLESIKRKFAAVDMESWGVLKACEHDPRISTVIIRCICDAADERKKELESETKDMLRRWTLHNGARFTRELLATLVLTDSGFHAPMGDRSNTQDSPEAKLHSTVEQNFLPLYGQQAKDTLGDVTAHERLFSSLSQWEVKPDDPGLFTAFKRSIEVSAEPDIEGVVGQLDALSVFLQCEISRPWVPRIFRSHFTPY